MATTPRSHNDYTVGWVCALPKEQTAATAMLDQRHAPLPKSPTDHNTYTLGSIGNHNIVIACLPKGKIGTNSAATVATQMINAFPSIKFGLMVGIGGGMPPKVRLGDVVVSVPTDQYPGVVQWDLGKAENGDKFKRIGALNNPPALLLTAVSTIETEHELNGPKIPEYLEELAAKYPRLAPKYLRSSSLKDVLFKANNDHRNDNSGNIILDHADIDSEEEEEEEDEDCCRYCDKTQVVRRKPRDMRVHYGLIASGNQVIKNATFRDQLRQDLGSDVLCVEMEAAGLMDGFPCIVIRGICDYADSHKNKGWQEHAAAVAAAFAKELLGCIQPSDVDQERAVKDILTGISNNLSCIQEDVTHTRFHLDKKEDLEILDWLIPTNYGPQQSDNFKRQQPGTGQWMLDSVEYQNWIKEPKKTLFCPGIPGAGKTILTSILVNDLKNRFYQDTTTAVAYIYCNFKRQHEQTSENLLSSLLKQLAQSLSSLLSSVKELYNRHNAERTRPSLDEISTILQLVTARFSRVFIVVDALDECQALNGCRTKFLDKIFSLQDKVGVNILATSRFIPEIMERFRGHTSIEIRASEGDIRGYLSGRLSELPKFVASRLDLQDEITTSITNSVDGMFLLAQLYFASLIGKDTPKALRNTLQKLSTGPNDYDTAYETAYDQAMERIEVQIQDQAKRAKQVLSWITCAKRPLTKLELQHALAVEINEPQLDLDNLPQVEDVVSVCAGLVTIDEETSVVRLVHYTTQGYFERTQGKWFPHAELYITNICIPYLSYRDFASGYVETDEKLMERLMLYPLYEYAAYCWGHHARIIPTYQENVLSFLLKEPQVEASFQVLMMNYEDSYNFNSQKTRGGTTGLHLAAYFGLDEAMKLLIDKHNTDVRDRYDETPFSWAAGNGHAAAVKVLLSTKGVDPDSKNKCGRTPLSWAARSGHEAVVKLLLFTERVNPDSKDEFGQTPLSWAARNGHEAVVKLLLSTERVDPDSKDEFGQTPLSWAAENGHEAVVKLLLSTERVDPDSKEDFGQTPLSWAVRNGHEAVVKLLLSTERVDPDSKEGSGQTPLSWAARNGHEAVVKLLLSTKRVDPDSKDKLGQTPLSLAAEEGHAAIVKLLLPTKGADFELRNRYMAPTLRKLQAARKGHGDSIELQLPTKWDPDFVSIEKYIEPMKFAADRGHMAIVMLLIGFELDSEDYYRCWRADVNWGDGRVVISRRRNA